MGDGPSEMIMLMTGLIVAGLVSTVLLSTWDTMSQGLENQGDLEIKDAKTRASLVSDPSACLLYTSPSPRDQRGSRMPSSA